VKKLNTKQKLHLFVKDRFKVMEKYKKITEEELLLGRRW